MAFAVGTFDGRSTAGDVTITLGFEMKFLLVIGTMQQTFGSFAEDHELVMGFAAGVTQNTQGYYGHWDGTAFFAPETTRGARSNEIISDFGQSGLINVARVKSISATQVVLEFIAPNTTVDKYQYLAIGGAGVTVATGQPNCPTSTGAQAIAHGLGTTPGLVVLIGGQGGDSANGSHWSLGFCDGTRQGVTAFQQKGNSNGSSGTPGANHSYQRTDKAIAVLADVAGTLLGEAEQVSLDATNINLNWTTAPSVAQAFQWVAIAGIYAHVGSLTQPTAAGVQDVTGLTVTPDAVLFQSFGVAASSPVVANLRYGVGLSDGTTQLASWQGDNDAIGAIANRRMVRYNSNAASLVAAHPTSTSSGATDAVGTAGSFTGGQFSVTWSAADSTARQVLFVALSDSSYTAPGAAPGDPTYVVTVGGVDINPILSTFRIQETTQREQILLCDLESQGSPYTRFALNDEVLVTENGVRIFGGYVTGLLERGISGPNGDDLVVEIRASSYAINAKRRYVTAEVSVGSPADTLADWLQTLIDDYLGVLGVTLHPSQVTGPSVPYFLFERQQVSDVLDTVCEAIGYVWTIDYENRLRAWAPGDILAPDNYDEDVNPDIFTGDITVERQLQDGYANHVRVVGEATVVPDQVDSFVGDGTTNAWTLTYPIVGPVPYTVDGVVGYAVVFVDGLQESIGGAASASLLWDYDPVTLIISRRSGPVGNGLSIVITYHGLSEPTAVAEDAGEQATYGLWEYVEAVPGVMSAAAAQSYADALLVKKLASKDEIVTAATRDLGYHPGQLITIASPLRAITGEYLITQVDTASEPGGQRLVRTITAAKSQNNDHDWRRIYQQWFGQQAAAGGTGASITSSAGAGLGLHATTHESGGTDPIQLDDLAAPSDNTDLDVSTSLHGLVPKITGSDGDVLTKSGASAVWSTPDPIGVASHGHLTEDGSSAPPVDLYTEDGTDWLYADGA